MTIKMFNLKGFAGITNEACPIIGAVKVNEPFTFHNNSYECAAWWQDEEAQLGVYPVYLKREYNYPSNLYAYAGLTGRVVDDYFPALWGGVAVSNRPYESRNIGTETTIHRHMDLLDAIEATGIIPGNKMDWYIHPSWWPVAIEEAMTEMKAHYNRLPEFWNEFNSLDKESFKPKMEGRWDYDSEYRSRLSMVAHMSGQVEKWARRIEKINVQQSYNSPYWNDLLKKNTEWIKDINIQINE